MIVIGYSGHAYVVIGILKAAGYDVTAYCDREEKTNNPFQLQFLGNDSSEAAREALKKKDFFIAIGDNKTRAKIFKELASLGLFPTNAVHPQASVSAFARIAAQGVMISSGVCINPLAVIGKAVICNTGCIIEHDCQVGDFAHIGPGTILCGNVNVGYQTHVGAGAVVRQGITIGNNCMIGAGAVVVKNIGDNQTVIGNPSREMIPRSSKSST